MIINQKVYQVQRAAVIHVEILNVLLKRLAMLCCLINQELFDVSQMSVGVIYKQ